MSSPPSQSPHPSDHQNVVVEEPSDAVSQFTLNPQQQTLHIPEDQQQTQLPQTLISQNQQGESEEEENPPISPTMPPTLTGSRTSSSRRGRKKKGKPNYKKLQVFDKKFQSLMKNLNPIPFNPPMYIDFAPYESLFRKLGLWDFVNIKFDTHVRKDLIAQLVATYESRKCYINERHYAVSRAELARAFKIPLFKKDKKNVGAVVEVDDADLEEESLTEATITFLSDFVSSWMLLHEDMWMMPEEVMNWIKVIKDGHPEKVDWAGMLWFMVDQELSKGENLRDCYYACHLQHFMKEQKVFLREEAEGSRQIELIEVGNDGDEEEEEDDTNDEVMNDVEEDVNREVPNRVDDVNREVPDLEDVNREVDEKMDDANAVEDEEVKVSDEVLDGEMKIGEMGGPSVELTLGQDSEKEEDVKDVDGMDFDNHEESDGEGENEQVQWLMNGKNDIGDHFMQHCSSGNGRELVEPEDSKVDEEEEEEEENEEFEDEEDDEEMGSKFHVFPTDALEGDGFTGNYLESMEGNQMSFGSHGHIHMQQMESGPSFLNETGKRGIEYENGIFNHSLGDNTKRLRINGPSEPKPVDFGTCMENAQQMMEKARMFYTEKEEALQQASINQEILLREVQRRDDVINELRKNRHEDNEKHHLEKIRYERELHLMGGLLKGYRNAMKATQKAFDEYRQRAQLPEEPVYKHVGGGLMLSTGEIERIRQKEEEEFRLNCLVVAQHAKDAESCFVGHMDACVEKIYAFERKLTVLEADVKELAGSFAKRKDLHPEEGLSNVVEPAGANEESRPVIMECSASEEIVTETAEAQANKEMELNVKELSANADKEPDIALLPADQDKGPDVTETAEAQANKEMELNVKELSANADKEPDIALLPADQDKGPDVTELPADEDKEPDVTELPADEAKEVDGAGFPADVADLPVNEVKAQDFAALPVDEVKQPEVAEAPANEEMLVD